MHGDESDRDVAGSPELGGNRGRRLALIVGIAIVLVLAGLIPYVIGSRAANDEISRVRTAAATVVVDGADLAAWAYGNAEVGPLATALGVEDDQVSAVSATGAEWCITVEVDRLLATRSIRFQLDAAGRLSETASCANS